MDPASGDSTATVGSRSASGYGPPHPDGAGSGASLLEDLLFCAFQTRFIEERLAEIGQDESFPSGVRPLRADPRTVAVAYAMERRTDGTGDVCAPGAAAPGPTLAFGGTPLEFLRHLTGRATAPNHGRGGGLNWTDRRHGLLAEGGIPGTMTQVLAGAALAFQRRREPRAALVFEPASAAETGGWHEGLNLAGALRVPLIVVLTGASNDAGVSARQTRDRRLSEAYGVQELSFSDESLLAILDAVGEARSKALGGEGPAVIRLLGPDPSERWAPLDRMVDACRTGELIPHAVLEQVPERASRDVDHAVRRLGREPSPDFPEALGPVRTDTDRVPPWTRQDPPQPGNLLPLEPRGGGGAF